MTDRTNVMWSPNDSATTFVNWILKKKTLFQLEPNLFFKLTEPTHNGLPQNSIKINGKSSLQFFHSNKFIDYVRAPVLIQLISNNLCIINLLIQY